MRLHLTRPCRQHHSQSARASLEHTSHRCMRSHCCTRHRPCSCPRRPCASLSRGRCRMACKCHLDRFRHPGRACPDCECPSGHTRSEGRFRTHRRNSQSKPWNRHPSRRMSHRHHNPPAFHSHARSSSWCLGRCCSREHSATRRRQVDTLARRSIRRAASVGGPGDSSFACRAPRPR